MECARTITPVSVRPSHSFSEHRMCAPRMQCRPGYDRIVCRWDVYCGASGARLAESPCRFARDAGASDFRPLRSRQDCRMEPPHGTAKGVGAAESTQNRFRHCLIEAPEVGAGVGRLVGARHRRLARPVIEECFFRQTGSLSLFYGN